ncbi:anthrone oxygenase family protein [Streptomyces sp. NPDC047046]|uniref:anthrone oxygenase family protein n=1 Tax=Streptomyces sp. NPDC047046 TaxID=3155378 RepID=UPI0033EB606E
MKTTTGAALFLAVLATGLMAGLFAAFAYAVMPGLGKGGDRTFVEAMRNINKAILNGWFLTPFAGALLVLALAAVGAWTSGEHRVFWWVIAALVLYVVMFAVTGGINVPLNDRLAAGELPQTTGALAAARERFESSWVAWNVVRALAATGSFACAAWGLVLYGRSTG